LDFVFLLDFAAGFFLGVDLAGVDFAAALLGVPRFVGFGTYSGSDSSSSTHYQLVSF